MAQIDGLTRIAALTGERGKLDDAGTERNGVVVGDDSRIAQAKRSLEVNAAVEAAKRGYPFAGGNGKLPIVFYGKPIQEAIRVFYSGCLSQPEFTGKAVLKVRQRRSMRPLS